MVIMSENENQIVVYQPNETVRLDVRLENETVWLNQSRLGELFGVDRTVINRHIHNIYKTRALVLKLISGAKKSLVLIDNWATVETLDLFAKKRKGVNVTVITSEHIKKGVAHHTISDSDVATFNAQYPKLTVRYNETFHDRFLIVDDKELYLIGASLKDLGKKCFAFTKLDAGEIARIKKAAFGTAAVKKGAK